MTLHPLFQSLSRVLLLWLLAVVLILSGLARQQVGLAGFGLEPWTIVVCGWLQALAGMLLIAFALGNLYVDLRVWRLSNSSPLDHDGFSVKLLLLSASGALALAAMVFGSFAETGGLIELWSAVCWSNIEHWSMTSLEQFSFRYPVTLLLAGSINVLLTVVSVIVLVLSLLSLFQLSTVWWVRQLQGISESSLQLLSGLPFLVVVIASRGMFDDGLRSISDARSLLVGGTNSAFTSADGVGIGMFCVLLFLGTQAAYGLWTWALSSLEELRNSPYGRLAQFSGRSNALLLLREVFWLERWEELLQRILLALSVALLIDILSNAVVDLFLEYTGSTMLPLIPTLGTLQFMSDESLGLGPDMLSVLSQVFSVVLFATVAIVILGSWIRRPDSPILADGELSFPAALLVRNPLMSQPDVMAPAPALNFVIGESGTGKTSLMWASHLQNEQGSLYLFQDPDKAMPAELSVAEVVNLVCQAGGQDWQLEVIRQLLAELDDTRTLNVLEDVLTPAQQLSRGERQRLMFCLGWSSALAFFELQEGASLTLYMDEFTSAQDSQRSSRMWKIIDRGLQDFADRLRLCITTHDPNCLRVDRWQRDGNRSFWFERAETGPSLSVLGIYEFSASQGLWCSVADGDVSPVFKLYQADIQALNQLKRRA